MRIRQEVIEYVFSDVYLDAPFHDENWQLDRSHKNKNALYGFMRKMAICVLI